jgi:hypothetical protein
LSEIRLRISRNRIVVSRDRSSNTGGLLLSPHSPSSTGYGERVHRRRRTTAASTHTLTLFRPPSRAVIEPCMCPFADNPAIERAPLAGKATRHFSRGLSDAIRRRGRNSRARSCSCSPRRSSRRRRVRQSPRPGIFEDSPSACSRNTARGFAFCQYEDIGKA